MLSWIFLLLALRSYILAWQPKKTSILRILDVALGTLSLALFLLLPREFHWQPFLAAAALIGFFIYRRFSKSPQEHKFSFQSLIGWSCLYIVGAFAAVSCTFFHLTADQKVGKIVMTGNAQSEWVSWKNPQSDLEGAWLDSYEVIVEDLKGKELSRQFLYGDLVGLRAEVLTIHWPFHLLGFSNLCHLEALHNGYSTSSRHNLFPHLASALPFSFPALQKLWTKLYHGQWKIPGVKSATLESTYLPLITAELQPKQGSYWLIVGNSGLTSIVADE
jgi:hypothetical protein